MTRSARVLNEALALPRRARLTLAQKIVDSVDSTTTYDELLAELIRRDARAARGDAGSTWDEVRREMVSKPRRRPPR
jgi:putative addiction module component (TIGR02574 family)